MEKVVLSSRVNITTNNKIETLVSDLRKKGLKERRKVYKEELINYLLSESLTRFDMDKFLASKLKTA